MPPAKPRTLFRFRLTRLGFHFLFVSLFAIVGGSLRGFNLLLVLAGLLSAVVLVQWRQGRACIRNTRSRRLPPGDTFVGVPIRVKYAVANVGRLLPIWMIRLTDRIVAEESVVGEHVDTLSTAERSRKPIELIASVGHVPAEQIRGTSIICRFSRRGHYRMGPLETSTSFPFSLMQCERLSPESKHSLYVYPERLHLRWDWTERLLPRRAGDGGRSSGGSGYDGEFFGLRRWQSGDNVKNIHWRTTARIGEPAVRQFERRSRQRICIALDGEVTELNGDVLADFELALRLATALLCHCAAEGRPAALLAADAVSPLGAGAVEPIREGKRGEHKELLRRLAVAAPVATSEGRRVLIQAISSQALLVRSYEWVVVSTRRWEDAVGDHWMRAGGVTESQSRALAAFRSLRASGRLCWLDVRSPQLAPTLRQADTAVAASAHDPASGSASEALLAASPDTATGPEDSHATA